MPRSLDVTVSECDPYKIAGPAMISFSGGRTSAYMLWHVINAYGGVLPDNIHVCFANTGKEREETLRFVYECGTRWGVHINWLEFVTDLASAGAGGRFSQVGYNSASRNGEPFDRLIERKKAIPSTISGRWCTERLKVCVIRDFMETLGYQQGEYIECIGFRADEADRVIELPVKPKNAGRRFAFPLVTSRVRKPDIFAWWKNQPFDLSLKRGAGNCDHCPFLNTKNRVARARLYPESTQWWAAHEAAHGGYSFGRESFKAIIDMTRNSPLLALDETDLDIADSECTGWCND